VKTTIGVGGGRLLYHLALQKRGDRKEKKKGGPPPGEKWEKRQKKSQTKGKRYTWGTRGLQYALPKKKKKKQRGMTY